MDDIAAALARWGLGLDYLPEPAYRVRPPREQRRSWWLLAQGWSMAKATALLEREAHSLRVWVGTATQRSAALR